MDSLRCSLIFSICLIAGQTSLAQQSQQIPGAARPDIPVQPAYASRTADSADLVKQGAKLYLADFTPEQGLRPLFNQRSCVVCHGIPTTGGMGWDGLGIVY